MHIPVLLKEVLEYLDPKPNDNFIDATVGDGGHAMAILEKTAPEGKLLAIDRDLFSVDNAKSKIQSSKIKNNVILMNDSFGNLFEIVQNSNFKNIKGILFDFGMSSSQLEESGRGFSFQKDEILDMRYDVRRMTTTAEDVINAYSEGELAEVFRKWGEEPRAKVIAGQIVASRKGRRIKTTGELAGIIEKAASRRGKKHPATLIFQALRIEVNQEFSEIEKALRDTVRVLTKGGRALFISFHSLEDRLIKNWAKNLNKQELIKILTKKPIIPSREEIMTNPRSRSAKLRAVEKINN